MTCRANGKSQPLLFWSDRHARRPEGSSCPACACCLRLRTTLKAASTGVYGFTGMCLYFHIGVISMDQLGDRHAAKALVDGAWCSCQPRVDTFYAYITINNFIFPLFYSSCNLVYSFVMLVFFLILIQPYIPLINLLVIFSSR